MKSNCTKSSAEWSRCATRSTSTRLCATWATNTNPVPTTVIRKAIFRQVGGFSTDRIFSLDVAFWLAASLGAKIVNVDDFLYLRRRRASSLTLRADLGSHSAIRGIYQNERRKHFDAIMAGRMRLAELDASPSAIAPRPSRSAIFERAYGQVTLDRRETYDETP